MKFYLQEKNTERFEKYRELAVSILENDETVGKWSKADKISKLRGLKCKA